MQKDKRKKKPNNQIWVTLRRGYELEEDHGTWCTSSGTSPYAFQAVLPMWDDWARVVEQWRSRCKSTETGNGKCCCMPPKVAGACLGLWRGWYRHVNMYCSTVWFLVTDMQLYTLPCRSVGHIFEFRAVFALLLLPNRPRLGCRVSGLLVTN